jgi:hypothetical protein
VSAKELNVMNRRRFLQVAGLAGLAVMAPIAPRAVRAGAVKYKGPFWIMVNAGGGWDPTMLCDPKGGDPMDPKAPNHSYTAKDILKAGNISYAPTELQSNNVLVQSCDQFFQAHHKRLLVVNGIDNSTNNHDAGSRTTWSGQLPEGYPSFAALMAAFVTQATPVPLAYLSNGGYDATAGLVSLTRMGGTDALERLAFTNQMNPNDTKTSTYHTPNTAGRIAAAQEARLKAAQLKEKLPTVASAMGSLYMARQSDEGLAGLGEELRSVKLVRYPDDFPQLAGAGGNGGIESLLQQVQIALHSFRAGVAVSANLDIGGFDTHSDHDNRQGDALMGLLFGVDYLFQQIDALGLTDQVNVMIGSDFGRTPFYNKDQGKDHWNLTSAMFSGPKIPGDKVVGVSDPSFAPLEVNATTLKADPSGLRIEPKHIHMALRQLGGVANTDLDKTFGFPGNPLPIFG